MSRLLNLLRWYKEKDDRAMMANLRCTLVDNKKHRAWPALNRLNISITDDTSAYIAGLFATHPNETSKGNFGDTCHAIEQKRGEKRSEDNKLTPTERRFQHLLNAEWGDELNGRVFRLLRMAKSLEVPVNYDRLYIDLRSWNERTRVRWAAAFWARSGQQLSEEEI